MDDLELTRRCAEAMGVEIEPLGNPQYGWTDIKSRGRKRYDPLRDFQQALAIAVKYPEMASKIRGKEGANPEDLNRALVTHLVSSREPKAKAGPTVGTTHEGARQ